MSAQHEYVGASHCIDCATLALSSLVNENADLRRQLADAKAKAEEVEYAGNLLAIIHGDGGHYISDHGWKKAVDDAMTKWYDANARIAKLEAAMRELEWCGTTDDDEADSFCPFCMAYEDEMHFAGCRYVAIIAPALRGDGGKGE